MKFGVTTALTVLALAFGTMSATQADAKSKSGVNIGSLNCTVEGGVGLIIGSSKSMKCTFTSSSGKTEKYTGRITKLGLDIGFTTKSFITWTVFAPGQVGKGALAGSYAGGSAEATVGVGLGANVLVGGFKDSVALQPISVQGQTGLNVAAGISGLKLSQAK
jgi:hypothetical protein